MKQVKEGAPDTTKYIHIFLISIYDRVDLLTLCVDQETVTFFIAQ